MRRLVLTGLLWVLGGCAAEVGDGADVVSAEFDGDIGPQRLAPPPEEPVCQETSRTYTTQSNIFEVTYYCQGLNILEQTVSCYMGKTWTQESTWVDSTYCDPETGLAWVYHSLVSTQIVGYVGSASTCPNPMPSWFQCHK